MKWGPGTGQANSFDILESGIDWKDRGLQVRGEGRLPYQFREILSARLLAYDTILGHSAASIDRQLRGGSDKLTQLTFTQVKRIDVRT